MIVRSSPLRPIAAISRGKMRLVAPARLTHARGAGGGRSTRPPESAPGDGLQAVPGGPPPRLAKRVSGADLPRGRRTRPDWLSDGRNRPVADLQGRPYQRTGSARKRSSAEGVGCVRSDRSGKKSPKASVRPVADARARRQIGDEPPGRPYATAEARGLKAILRLAWPFYCAIHNGNPSATRLLTCSAS